jgi:AcrR family transcriptional regulator
MTTSKPRKPASAARGKRATAKGGARGEAGRTRRTAEVARETILEAAERQLVAAGPAGLRLQEIAAEAGVSHPTVLHHFGSRDGLLQEVVRRTSQRLHDDVAAALVASPTGVTSLASLLERITSALDATGHGRAFGWLALAGLVPEAPEPQLQAIARVAHAIRHERHGGATPPVEDTEHVVALVTIVLLAQSFMGSEVLASAGLGAGPEAGARFRGWLARLIVRHLDQAPSP